MRTHNNTMLPAMSPLTWNAAIVVLLLSVIQAVPALADHPSDSLYWGSKDPSNLIRSPIVRECWSSDQTSPDQRWTVLFDHALVVKVVNLHVFMEDITNTNDIVLVLDNVLLEGIRAYSVNTHSDEVRFRMRMDDFDEQKSKEWANVFGPLNDVRKSVSVSIARSGGTPIATLVNKRSMIDGDVVRTAKGGGGYALNVVVVGTVRLWVSILLALLCDGAVLLAAFRTGIFRASEKDPAKRKTAPFSLALVQMGFWYVIVVFSMLFLWVVTGSYVPIPPTVLGIVGISTLTGLVAGATDKRKIERAAAIADQEGVDTKRHTSFFRDLITDATGNWSLQRVQILVWNLLFGAYYCYQVYRMLTMPDIDESMLVLMGLSSSAYIGGKMT